MEAPEEWDLVAGKTDDRVGGLVKARYWHIEDDGRIRCDLCPQGCLIAEGGVGRCRVRGVRGGALEALAYGRVSSLNIDPIEKKPLYHFRPGSSIFSLGGWGCNLRCRFCQNWEISQQFVSDARCMTPEQVVEHAVASECGSLAYTYNEPLIGFEFVRDCAVEARARGLANVLVTNGFVCPEPADDILEFTDAVNVDLKSFDDSFYMEQCGGKSAPVFDFARRARQAGCHVEATNLLIPGVNSEDCGIRSLACWIGEELGPMTPLHLSAYFPRYRCDVAATPIEMLQHAYELCKPELLYVYLGNVSGAASGQNTVCPGCGQVLIERRGYSTRVCGIQDGKCRKCGRAADIV